MKQLPKIESLAQLSRLVAGDSPAAARYQRLAILAAQNLGMMEPPAHSSRPLVSHALQHLKAEADAMDDDRGVVKEVNFMRDIELKESQRV